MAWHRGVTGKTLHQESRVGDGAGARAAACAGTGLGVEGSRRCSVARCKQSGSCNVAWPEAVRSCATARCEGRGLCTRARCRWRGGICTRAQCKGQGGGGVAPQFWCREWRMGTTGQRKGRAMCATAQCKGWGGRSPGLSAGDVGGAQRLSAGDLEGHAPWLSARDGGTRAMAQCR